MCLLLSSTAIINPLITLVKYGISLAYVCLVFFFPANMLSFAPASPIPAKYSLDPAIFFTA